MSSESLKAEWVRSPSSERAHGVCGVFFVESERFEKKHLSIVCILVYPEDINVPWEWGMEKSWKNDSLTVITERVLIVFFETCKRESVDSEPTNVVGPSSDGCSWISDNLTFANDEKINVGAFTHQRVVLLIVTVE